MPRQKKADAAAPAGRPVEIRYDGPTASLEVTQDGVTIPRGKSDYVSVEMAEHLLGCTYADVTVLSGDTPAVWPGTDAKLDALASQLDVEFPQPANGEPPLTVADKVRHLEAAGYSPDGSRSEASANTNEEE